MNIFGGTRTAWLPRLVSEVTPEERVEAARKYRDAVELYLPGTDLDAVGAFQRPEFSGLRTGSDIASLLGLLWRSTESLVKHPVGRLPGMFLLAVTQDKVHAFKCSEHWWSLKFRISKEVAIFDRNAVNFEVLGNHDTVDLQATVGDRTHSIKIDGEAVKEDPLAAEVIATLDDSATHTSAKIRH